MNLIGIRLNLLIGPAPAALPAPPGALEKLESVEVTHSDRERSGFQLVFTIGRSGPLDFLDYDLVQNPLFRRNARVVLTAIFDVRPRVIMDGIVRRVDVSTGGGPGRGRLTLSGHDVSVMLDREVRQVEHPAQDETVIAAKLIASYPQYGLIPMVIPPVAIDPPLPIDRTPQQDCSDWAYLQRMAGRHGYVTYVEPGPAPLTNMVYWGPRIRPEPPQCPLNVDLGPLTNVDQITAANDADAPTTVQGFVKDRQTGQTVPVVALVPSRPPLGLAPDTVTDQGSIRSRPLPTTGLNAVQAFTRAQAIVDYAADGAHVVSGSLNAMKYNDALRARGTVELRGAGATNDGAYLVRKVTHRIQRGSYTQDFVLSRAETGAKLPVVRPC